MGAPFLAERCPDTGLVLLVDHRPKQPQLLDLLEPQHASALLISLQKAHLEHVLQRLDQLAPKVRR